MGMLKETVKGLFASPDGKAGKDKVLFYEKIVVAVALVVILIVTAVSMFKIENKAVLWISVAGICVAVYFIHRKETADRDNQKPENE